MLPVWWESLPGTMPHERPTTITVAKSLVTVLLSTICACDCWSCTPCISIWEPGFHVSWKTYSILCCSGVAETELEQYSSVLHLVKCSTLCAIWKHLELVAPRVWQFMVASVQKSLRYAFCTCPFRQNFPMAIMPSTKAMILAFAHLGRSYPAQQTWDHVPVWKGRKAHDRHD